MTIVTNTSVEYKPVEFLFGSGKPDMIFFDQIYMLAKQYIYNCKCLVIFPSLDAFKRRLFHLRDIENVIAQKNGKENEFHKKWHLMLSY